MIGVLLALLSFPAAILPAVASLWLMWWLDRYDREPVWLMGVAFAWGATGAATAAVLVGLLLDGALVGDPHSLETLSTVLLAPLIEEPAKALVLVPIIRSRHFDNATDGFVYGAAAGIGFGMTENLLYFADAAADGSVVGWSGTVVVRTLYSAMMHACASSLVGAAAGWAKYRRRAVRAPAVALGLIAAIAMHLLWNGLLVLARVEVGWGLLDFALFPVEFVVLFGLFQASLLDEHRILREELGAEAEAGTLPAEHVPILATWLRRSRPGWLPPSVPHHEYVRTATLLAFRRHQDGGRGDAALEAEQRVLRERLRDLLRGTDDSLAAGADRP